MATDNRKKIQFYLYPELKSQDATAIEHCANMPTGLRSHFYRNAILAGVALSKVDPRLIELLAAGLGEKMDREDVINLIHSITLKGHVTPPQEAPAPKTTLKQEPSAPNIEQVIEPKPQPEPATAKTDEKGSDNSLKPEELESLRSNLAI